MTVPYIFATQPSGNVPAAYLDADFAYLLSQIAPTVGTDILSGDGSGGFANITIGANLTFSGGTLSATGGGGTSYPAAGFAYSTGSAWAASSTAGAIVGTFASTGTSGGSTRSGYHRFSTGLILNWGLVVTSGAGTATVTFPLAFPTACFGVIAQSAESVTPFNGCISAGQTGLTSLTQANIQSTTTTSGGTPVAGPVAVYWFAYGY